ncbi:MAG: type III pantothenate kinase [Bacteroidaceae bacterium]|nr:type III pantothenate kinase [Bacteroidaceae bacterium]
MNLVIDIGNTTGKYFCFEGDELQAHGSEEGHALTFLSRFATGVSAAIVSSVVDLPAEAEARLQALPYPVVRFTPATPVPLQNCYLTPATLGSDRLAAAVGAWAQQPGRPLLIIDAGSCITFDFVTAEGEYLGGNIAPGIHARLRAIGDYFPRLPHVAVEGDVPEMGYDTETAIRAGVIEGMKHEIEGYIAAFRKKYADLLVFLTGGDDFRFDESLKNLIFADHFIVPRGLNYILAHQPLPMIRL